MMQTELGPVILDLKGLVLTPEEKEILQHPNVGGIIFFSRNYDNPEQLAELVQQIRLARSNCLLCVDQEGGRVQRFKNQFTLLPALRKLGDLVDNQVNSLAEVLSLAEQLGYLMALEIRSFDIDLSFAPVLDLDNISDVIQDRAFHSDPQMVSRLASAYIKGMAQAGMKATGKHFPGHGSVKADSHFELPADLREWDAIKEDLLPFQELIKQGIDALMPAHIIYPQIDPNPVGFSSFWLQEVLRKQLNFNGTIVSDDLMMSGASGMGDFPLRAERALAAGCDFILICNHPDSAIKTIEGLRTIANPHSQQRRQNLLGSGENPSWRDLKRSRQWQQAFSVMDQLEREKVI